MFFFIFVSILAGFRSGPTILSHLLLLPTSQLRKHEVMTSQTMSRIKYVMPKLITSVYQK